MGERNTFNDSELRNIKIAEACGLTIDNELVDNAVMVTGPDGVWDMLPDYCNDLNAMHDAEELMGDGHAQVYFEALAETTGAQLCDSDLPHSYNYFSLYHATAMQRAKAFIKTI